MTFKLKAVCIDRFSFIMVPFLYFILFTSLSYLKLTFRLFCSGLFQWLYRKTKCNSIYTHTPKEEGIRETKGGWVESKDNTKGSIKERRSTCVVHCLFLRSLFLLLLSSLLLIVSSFIPFYSLLFLSNLFTHCFFFFHPFYIVSSSVIPLVSRTL